MCPLTSRRHQNITFLPGAVRTHRVLHIFRCNRLWIMWPLTLFLKQNMQNTMRAHSAGQISRGCRCIQRADGLYNDCKKNSRNCYDNICQLMSIKYDFIILFRIILHTLASQPLLLSSPSFYHCPVSCVCLKLFFPLRPFPVAPLLLSNSLLPLWQYRSR